DEYLIIDNQGYNSERETPLPNDLTIYNLSIERGAELTIDNETTLNVTYLNGSGTLNLFGTLDANNFINSDMSELTIQNYNGNLTFLTESNYFNITSGARLELGGIEMSYINPNLELTVKSGGTLSHVDNVDQFDYYLAHLNYDDKPSYNLNLTLPKLTIESGASIDVTGKGWSGGDFRNNTGIGFGAGSDPSVTGGGSGGGYGGFGSGTSTSNPPGSYYGSMVAPFYLGSGGGDCTAGHGGGAVYLNISTLILDGSIISSGSKGGDVDCDYLSREGSGGGSGGSIYIITKNISGSGNLVAEGGNGGDDYASDNGGSGGGGRIALYALDDISSLSTSTAGGRAPDNPVYEGDSGTLFICNSNGSFYCYGDGSNYSFVRTGSILQNTIFSITHTNEINRTFNYAWNQTYLKWSDEATDSSTVATYNITGLLPSTDYYIIDNSLAAPDSPKSTDGTGQLELFNISLSSPHEIEVLEADPSIIPAVTLEYPVNLIEENTRTITYRYSVTSSAEIASCSLYIGESLNETDNTITIDINQTFTVALDNGEFNWSVNCIDMFDRQGNSSMGYFNISAYLNLTVNLDPNPAENEQEVTVSGHVNTTGGEDAADTLLDIFLNGTSILPDWSYKQPINITENTGSDLDEYQVNVSIDTASLISAGKMSSNCSDIKFEDTEGNNLFYWIEDDWDQIDYATSAQGATCSGGTSCTNAIDNAYSISNYWEIASPQDETLTELGVVDLGAIKDIGRISIHLYDGNTRSYYNYAIQVSEDNVNWNTWFNGTGSGINYQSLQTITHDVENVRYIKVFISGSTSNAIGHIIELYAYEKANSCNSENTKIWINTNLTASTEETVYMYYGNDGVESASNGTEVFDFFDNFNDASIGPEWTHDAGSAVEAGGVIVLKGDELYGNFNGVPGYTVEALAKKTTDNNYCAVGFSGWWNSNPSNVGVSTISGWGTGDVLTRYSGDGAGSLNLNIHKWTHYKIDWIDSTHQTYYANENSRAITHASYPSGLPTPGLAATDGTDTIMEVDWVFVRKYASAEPTINLGIEEVLLANTNATGDYVYTFAAPATNGDYEVKVNLTYNGMDAEINDTLTVTTPITVTTSLIGPTNNNYSVSLTDEITFECNASVSGPGELINITLYHNIDGTWIANGTEEITGTENSTTFTKNITDIIGANKFKDTSITWNCLAQGTSGNSDWGDSNYIFSSWDLGSYDNITLNSNNISLIPNNTGQYENQTGTYISKIYNAGFEASWNNLTWDEALPYGDEGEANRSEVVAYYKFNENALDSSGNGNDATITGNVANISGKLNGAYYFDGNGDYVSNSNISFMSSYTLSAWMKADSGVADGYKSIISRGAIFDSNTNFAFGLRYANPNHQLFLYYDGGTLRGLAPTIEDPTAEWHHVAARFDETNNEMAVYLDGIQVSSYVQPDGPGDGGQSLKIGSPDTVDSTDDPFSGSLDEVLIYNRILSDSEVLDLYKRGINKLNISTRTCNDASCDTETYDVDCTDSTFCDLSSLTDNQYFQYKVNFETEDTNYTPELLTESVEIEYGPVIENPPEILTIYPNSTGGESSESITIVNVYISEPENQSFNITYNNESAVLIRWFVDDIEQIAYQNLTQYDWTGNYTQNGTYDIFVNVSNDAGSSHQYWNLDINNTAELPSTTEYYNTSETTDFSSVPDVASVVDMVLGNTYANITWSSLVNAEGLDFDNYMEFGDRYVYVNSASLDTSINSTALVTLKGVDCDVDKTVYYSPTANTWTTILNENTECPDTICTQITCEGTTISFYVQHFSGFASGANANLTIDHDGPKNTDVNITFDAFYVNKTSGDLVTGAECNITFEDDPGTTYPMIELADKYRYNKSFSSQGTYNYNVTCDQAEFSLLNASDSVEVTVITAELAISDTGPEFVNANVTFDANYTNKSSDLLITGAVCNISFSDNPGTTYSMIELSDIYQYNKSFSTHNSYDYTIICDSVDSTYLTDTSFLLIISSDPDAVPEFSTITMLIALTVVIGGFVMIRKRELY
ncbi:MAG: DUF2341 domain-containing protein, partial [Nanoarchaeota archaeon]|nr:DUF2341 domain-containing protein [Nanoarchaeota archaeon]